MGIFGLPLAQFTGLLANASTKNPPFELILGYVPLAHHSQRVSVIHPRQSTTDWRASKKQGKKPNKSPETLCPGSGMIRKKGFKALRNGNKVMGGKELTVKRPLRVRNYPPNRRIRTLFSSSPQRSTNRPTISGSRKHGESRRVFSCSPSLQHRQGDPNEQRNKTSSKPPP